jgi:hypothetical protein
MIASLIAMTVLSGTPVADASAFQVKQVNGAWWLVKPSGERMWSLGSCCTGPGEDNVNPKNPGYSGPALYGTKAAWAKVAKKQLQPFNTLGGWSDQEYFPGMPFTPVLHLGAYAKAPYNDLFDPANIAIMDKAAKDQISKLKDVPGLIGYFSDNELGWWRESLFTSYLSLPNASAGKQEVISILRTYYRDQFSNFLNDWDTKATSFDTLDGSLTLRPGTEGMQAVIAWQTHLTRHYYRLMNRLIRKYDSRHLILGDRYAQFYYLNVAQTARPYVDVISTNYGAEWNNGDTSKFFLDSLHAVTQKPVLITEFYMAANQNRSGNKNSSGGFPVVETQRQRADAVGKFLASIISRPYVIGAHWFQFYDEPTHGRGDGENYNMGVVDIHGAPYQELNKVFTGVKFGSRHGNPVASSTRRIPPAPKSVTVSLRDWDKSLGTVLPKTSGFADLILSQDAESLYVGLIAMDFMDEAIYEGKTLPDADRADLNVRIGKVHLRVRFGGKKPVEITGVPGATVTQIAGIKSQLMIKIPGAVPRGPVKVSGTLLSHARAERMEWDTTVQNP